MFKRRAVRYCAACCAKLVRREDEELPKFLKRATCNKDCAQEMRNSKKKTAFLCFCGKPRSVENAPYCCWDHRLVAMKCKRWGFEPCIKQYEKHASMLDQKQREIDVKCRPDPNVYIA